MLYKSPIVQDAFQPVLGLISCAGATRRWGLLLYLHGMWPYGTGYKQYVIKPLVEWQTWAVCGFSPCKHIPHTHHYHFTIVVRVIPHIAAPFEHCVFCEFYGDDVLQEITHTRWLTPVLCSTYFLCIASKKCAASNQKLEEWKAWGRG